MNTPRNTRILLAATVLAAPLFLATGPADATAGPGGDQDCQLDPTYLPRTPDAIEGWFRACHTRQATVPATATAGPGGDQDCQLDPTYLPRTPDAIEAWFRACHTRQATVPATVESSRVVYDGPE